ncbi:MAG: S-layer homology domain-containing protein [Oscillospiraceae bacterium]|nr:S-layer homology domain-containing protein [Oscillospiraceae bacterium]
MKRRVLSLILALALCLGLMCMPASAEDYSLWVGGERVTSENAADVFGDGTVSYDSVTKTLTLNGYVYTGQGYKSSSMFMGIYWSSYDQLTVQLVGENEIRLAPADAGVSSAGVYGYGGITFMGSGSLLVRGGDTDGASSYGMYTSQQTVTCGNDFTGSVTGIGGDVSGRGDSFGLYLYSGAAVYNGAVTGIGGDHSGAGGCLSCGIRTPGGSILLYGGAVTGVGGDVFTEEADTSVESFGINGSNSYGRYDVFGGTMVALGGRAAGASGYGSARSAGLYAPMNELPGSTYYSRSYGPGLNVYGGTVIALGGAADRADPADFTRVYSFGTTGSNVNADGGALVARAGTVNGGFRMATYDYYFYTHRAAINTTLALGEDSVIARAAGWALAAGTDGYGELTVTSEHSGTRSRITGIVGEISDWKEELKYRSSVPVEASGVVIVPASWTETTDAGDLGGDAWLVNLASDGAQAGAVDLGAYTLLCADLYEGTEAGRAAGLTTDSVTGSGGGLIAVGPLLSGSGTVSSGLFAPASFSLDGDASVICVGGCVDASYGLEAPKGGADVSGITGNGQFLAAGLDGAYAAAGGIQAGSLAVVDEGPFYRAASPEVRVPEYTVTVVPGGHMTLADGSGELTQTGVSGEMDPVIFTADDGYSFPSNYAYALTGSKAAAGLTVTRNSDKQITVSGVPGRNVRLPLPDAELILYSVWLGGVRVTGTNRYDLTAAINENAKTEAASGTASYDPASATLTLEDFSYTGEGFEYSANRRAALYVEDQGLNVSVTGDNRIVQHKASVGENDWSVGLLNNWGGAVRVSGKGSLLLQADAVDENKYNAYGARMSTAGDLIADGVDLRLIADPNVTGTSRGVMFVDEGDLIARNGGTLECSGGTTAVYYNDTDDIGYLVYGDEYYVLAGTAADGSDAGFYDGTGNNRMHYMTDYRYIRVETAELFLAGVPVTESNAADLVTSVNAVYPGAASGTASFDWDTRTLTLNGAAFTNLCTGSTDKEYNGMMYLADAPLTIVLEGDSSITGRARRNDAASGLWISKSGAEVRFTGSGSLTLTGGSLTGYDDSYGIYSYGSLTVDGPAVTAVGGHAQQDSSFGCYASGGLTLNSGSFTARGGGSDQDYSYGMSGTTVVNGGTLLCEGGDSYETSYGFSGTLTVNNGDATVKGGKATSSSGYDSVGVSGYATVNGGSLTVQADTGTDDSYGIDGTLTVSGGKVSVTAGTAADYSYGVYGSCTVNSGEVSISGGQSNGEYGYSRAVSSTCTINGGSVELISLDAYSSQAVGSRPSLGEKAMVLIASPNSDGSEPVEYDSYNYDDYRYIKTGMAYNLWVGDTRVNPGNAEDVLGDGKVRFDAATATLTLDGASVIGTTAERAAITYSDEELGALTIAVSGANTVTRTEADDGYYTSKRTAIDSTQPLTIQLAEGSALEVTGPDISYNSSDTYYTVYAGDALTIDGPGVLNVNGSRLTGGAYGTTVAIGVGKALTLSGGADVTVSGGAGDGSTANYYGTIYSSRSLGIRLQGSEGLAIGDGCTLRSSGGTTRQGGDSSYNGDSIGLVSNAPITLSLAGSGSAIFAGSPFRGYNSYGTSCGAMFSVGYWSDTSSADVTVAADDWSGTVIFQGEDRGVNRSGYGSVRLARDESVCDMTGYAEIEDAEGVELPDAAYSLSDLAYRKLLLFAHRTFTVSVTHGEGMTPADAYSENVTCTRSMTEQTYTADEGYYFPEDYAVDPVNGITVTRDSWTAVTVSGTPTADADVILIDASPKTKEDASGVGFTASGYDCGELTGLTAAAAYTASGAAEAGFTAAGDSYSLTGVTEGTLSVVMKATDANTRLDSDAVTITVTRATAPTLTAVQPDTIGGTGSIPTDKSHEYSTDGETWTPCTGPEDSLQPGTYYVRTAAAGTVLASDPQTLVIVEYEADREPAPSAVFTATGFDTGVLSGLEDGVGYVVSGAAAAEFTADGTMQTLSGVAPGTLSVVRKGNGSTTADSLPETITVTRAEAPALAAVQPDAEGSTGSIPTDATHEISTDGLAWTACTGTSADLAQGSYYVRTAASGTVLASDAQIITIAFSPKYSVVFSAGAGSGSMDAMTELEPDTEITLPDNGFTAPEGKEFSAWGICEDEYAEGDVYAVKADTTVTALWSVIPPELPESCDFDVSIRVAVSVPAVSDNVKIRYTTDGTDPGPDSGYEYAGPFELMATTVVKAVTVVGGTDCSEIVQAVYTLAPEDDFDDYEPVTVIDSGDSVSAGDLDELIGEGETLTVIGEGGAEAEFDTAALEGVDKAADGRIKLWLREVTGNYRGVYPGFTVWELAVTCASEAIRDYGGAVTVTIPRLPGENENPARVTIMLGTETGELSPADASYDPAAGVVTLTDRTGGLLYVIGYEPFPFTDVSADSYYYDAVDWAELTGVTTGASDTLFDPRGEATRAQTVTFLWRAMGCPEPDGAGTPFADVAESAYYCKAVLWAVEQGITKGTGEGLFSPNEPVTRAQTATFLWRLAGMPSAKRSAFADVDPDSYYAKAVDWAYAMKITEGTTSSTFSPRESCLRCQIVTFLYRFFHR